MIKSITRTANANSICTICNIDFFVTNFNFAVTVFHLDSIFPYADVCCIAVVIVIRFCGIIVNSSDIQYLRQQIYKIYCFLFYKFSFRCLRPKRSDWTHWSNVSPFHSAHTGLQTLPGL